MKHIKLFEQFANEAMKANLRSQDIEKAIGETIKGVKFLFRQSGLCKYTF